MTRDEATQEVSATPEPGSVWVNEMENLRWIYIAQDGHNAVGIQIRKSTGEVMQINLHAYITSQFHEISIACPEQEAADTLRELRNQAGRSVPQYSDPAGE